MSASTEVASAERIATITEPKRNWREEDGIIYFSVTSNGMTGEEWIANLEAEGYWIGGLATDVLRSKDFKPTSGVTTEIAVLKGMLFVDDDRITSKIRAFAAKRKLTAPNAEVACLIRMALSGEEIEAMGLRWIIAMHDSINDAVGDPLLLCVHRDQVGRRLDTWYGRLDGMWGRDDGFSFAVPQVSSEN